jgi:hypothetical protein
MSELLGEVVGLSQVLDQPELGLQPVGVLLLRHEDAGEEVLAGVVALVAAELDAVVEALDRAVLELEVGPELLGDCPMVSRSSRWKLGSPSRKRMRSASRSACFISSMDSCRTLWAMRR